MRLSILLFAVPLFAGTPIVDNDVRDLAGRKIAAGSITVCPVAPFTSGSYRVTKDCTTITVSAGAAKADLIPTDTAVPPGQYYRAKWKTSVTWDEYWQVPTSASALTLRDLVVSLPPTPPTQIDLTQIEVASIANGTYCLAVAGGMVTGLSVCTGGSTTPPGSAFDLYTGLFDDATGLFDSH